MTNGSVQVRLDLTAIKNGVVCFGSSGQAEYCAVMEVGDSQESLAKIDDAKQEELLAAYAQFLNSLTFPFQLVVQVHPVDLSWYVMRVEERARALSPALLAIARDHAAYVQGLTRRRTLLERRIYIVVSWSSSAGEGHEASAFPLRPLLAFLLRLLGRSRRKAMVRDDHPRPEIIERLLGDRCDVIGRQLSRTGLRATRLDDVGLAHLYHVGWAPEAARIQRLRRELADYTALVVGADPRQERQGLSAGDQRDPLEKGRQAVDWASGQ